MIRSLAYLTGLLFLFGSVWDLDGQDWQELPDYGKLLQFFSTRFQDEVGFSQSERNVLRAIEKEFNSPALAFSSTEEDVSTTRQLKYALAPGLLKKIEEYFPEKYALGLQVINRDEVRERLDLEGVEQDVSLLSSKRTAKLLNLTSTQSSHFTSKAKEFQKLLAEKERDLEKEIAASWESYRTELLELLPRDVRNRVERTLGEPVWPMIRHELAEIQRDHEYELLEISLNYKGKAFHWVPYLKLIQSFPPADQFGQTEVNSGFTFRVLSFELTSKELGLSQRERDELAAALQANSSQFNVDSKIPSDDRLRQLLSKDRDLPSFLDSVLTEAQRNRLLQIETQASLDFPTTFGLLNPIAIECLKIPDQVVGKIVDAEKACQTKLAELRAKHDVEIRRAQSTHIAESMKHLDEQQLAKYRSTFGF